MEPDVDHRRLQSNLIRLGTVTAVDLTAARCRVTSGGLLTDWLPWLTGHAGARVEWSAPSIGEQVIVLSPGGDLHGALVLRGAYSDTFTPPGDTGNQHITRYADGAVIAYDDTAHALTATLPDGGTATLTASGGVTINGPLTVNGDTQINGDAGISGTATATVDVIGGGKHLKTHTHGGVSAGGATSGPPT